ncbi:hypothetical protein PVK06_020187 [Gossypium arboreum]|uniref:Reverse transcriptase n=1 Tax=Gossypium arboreum TaxID=29729 RepID=A0ABR0PLR3_GOSAR|nr:hypothetical protein PVK06_020187 [Gossypium arboreum]
MVEKYPFIASSVIRQSQSDHDAIMFNLHGRKPKCHPHDNRLHFCYEECWALEKDVKRIINKAWVKVGGNYGNKLENVHESLVILPDCTSQNQSAFVPGRMIHDNILIAHELLHYHQISNHSSNKGCVIKLDMSKAYNRVEWNFIEAIMINSWTKRLLSYGSKEILIKAVLQSIPTYALSIFFAPNGVLKDFQTKLSRTWWSGREKGKFWSMLP